MGCMKCCAIFIPCFAIVFPMLHSLAFNGWMNDYFPSPGWTVDQMPDMSGKVAIVTGPTIKGIGYESCVELAKKGAHVILAGRSQSKGEAALQALKERAPAAKAEFMILDLGDLKSVKAFANAFIEKGIGLHILLNNAGIMANPFTLTADGIESQFGTNHVGHFLLTELLLPVLEKSAPSRVVSVSSAAAFAPDGFPPVMKKSKYGLNFSDVFADSKPRYSPFAAYGRSKLANVLFASGFARRLADKKVFVNSCHPGGIQTNLGRHIEANLLKKIGDLFTQAFSFYVNNFVLMTASQGAVTQLYLATSPDIETQNIRGKYYYPQARPMAPPASANREKEDELWEVSKKLIAGFV
eukprot:TRINITY_DN34321_c0_g1_i1.p1 TRINITY_DN34321_c0_g1~~TRINITY_DN34321_c0_g1_i1.p1  ORF type:complete len:354 (-),score=48.61 TRINITY_DN34321_c0_g1_i1:39-1100(-)